MPRHADIDQDRVGPGGGQRQGVANTGCHGGFADAGHGQADFTIAVLRKDLACQVLLQAEMRDQGLRFAGQGAKQENCRVAASGCHDLSVLLQ